MTCSSLEEVPLDFSERLGCLFNDFFLLTFLALHEHTTEGHGTSSVIASDTSIQGNIGWRLQGIRIPRNQSEAQFGPGQPLELIPWAPVSFYPPPDFSLDAIVWGNISGSAAAIQGYCEIPVSTQPQAWPASLGTGSIRYAQHKCFISSINLPRNVIGLNKTCLRNSMNSCRAHLINRSFHSCLIWKQIQVMTRFSQILHLKSVSHRLPLCNKQKLWPSDVGYVFYWDSLNIGIFPATFLLIK